VVAQIVTESIEGVVSRANGKGFTLAGRDGWLNLSRYADPVPAVPAEGARVRVGLDKAGFVRVIEPAGAGAEEAPGAQPLAASLGDKDTRITRLAALNTATAILSSGPRAARLEAWVMR